MAIREKTVEYAFNVDTATLASATRRDLAAITLYLPETTTRTFRSVIVEVNARSNDTANCTATLIGIKLGATAFDDLTNTVTWTATADQYGIHRTRDVTSYFTTNFGAGGSQTCQVGVSFTGPITQNHSVKIIITYSYDTADNTRVKTVRIPIESPTGQLTNTLASIGSNQIPNLDSFLPEASKTYRAVWFEFYYNDGSNSVTDFNLEVALDAEAGVDIAICESAANTSVFAKTTWRRDDMTTNATHDLKARSDNTTARIGLLSCVLHVTYEFNNSSTSAYIRSLVMPLDHNKQPWESAAGDEQRIRKDVWIEEPATIAMVQSGILGMVASTGAINITMQVGAQSAGRTYSQVAGSAEAGTHPFLHRIDSGGAQGASQTLARGKNVIEVDFFKNALGTSKDTSFLLFLNYTCGNDDDEADHNQTTIWATHPSTTVFTTEAGNTAQNVTPTITPTSYFVTSIGWEIHVSGNATAAHFMYSIEQASGENEGAGWVNVVEDCALVSDGEFGHFILYGDASKWFDRWVGDPAARMDPEVAHDYTWSAQTTSVAVNSLMYLTTHAITAEATGTITGSAGGTVNVYLHRKDTGELLASGSRTGNGTYTLTWYDDTVTCFVDAYEDGTHIGRSNDGTLTLV